MRLAIKQQCYTPECHIRFIPAPGQTLCLLCETKIRQESYKTRLKEAKELQERQTVSEKIYTCRKCDAPVYVCSSSSIHPDQDTASLCDECFVLHRWELNREKHLPSTVNLLPCVPGGPVPRIEATESQEIKNKTLYLVIKFIHSDKIIHVNVDETALVYDIVLTLKNHVDVPFGGYQLLFAGKHLKLYEPISLYKIQNDSVIFFIARLRGS